jgi:hypothetical protein
MDLASKVRRRKLLASFLVVFLIVVVSVAIGMVSVIRRLPTPLEYKESHLLGKELRERFANETIYIGGEERGRFVLTVYGILDKEKQNAIRDYAMVAKSKLALVSNIRLEFFEKEEWTVYPPDKNGVWGRNRRSKDERLLRIEEF